MMEGRQTKIDVHSLWLKTVGSDAVQWSLSSCSVSMSGQAFDAKQSCRLRFSLSKLSFINTVIG